MNKHEQILMRVWKSDNTAQCFRTDEHVVVHNRFAILLLNNLDRINPDWTYDSIREGRYDECMREIDNWRDSFNKVVNLPDQKDIKRFTSNLKRDVAKWKGIDLTKEQLDVTGKYMGNLKINVWYLQNFMWALGNNLNGFWSGQVVYHKREGKIRTCASGGLYLCGSNGQACIMPVASEVDDE